MGVRKLKLVGDAQASWDDAQAVLLCKMQVRGWNQMAKSQDLLPVKTNWPKFAGSVVLSIGYRLTAFIGPQAAGSNLLWVGA